MVTFSRSEFLLIPNSGGDCAQIIVQKLLEQINNNSHAMVQGAKIA